MSVVIMIPARMGAQRLPGKPLLQETGRPLIRHVYEAAAQARSADRVIVATDDGRIADAVRAFGGEAAMTRADHSTGSSRIAEVAERVDAEIVVNLQGDEPEIDPVAIDRAVAALRASGAFAATLAAPFPSDAAKGHGSPDDPAAVKACLGDDRGGWRPAVWFSRAPTPHPETPDAFEGHFLHIGLYAYWRDSLLRFAAWAPGRLERIERLEQLRILENGGRIAAVTVDRAAPGIDTPEDYAAFVARVAARAA